MNVTASILKNYNRNKELAFDVQRIHSLDNRLARLAIKVSPVYQKMLSEDALEVAVAKMFPNVRYLKNSLHRAGEVASNIFGIFVARNDRTMSIEQAAEIASTGSMTKVNDTVYQDENDAIWTVHSAADGNNYLVAQVDEDINDLLGGVQIRSVSTASFNLSMEEDFGAGNYVAFYDATRAEIAYGIAVDGSKVFNVEREVIQTVDAGRVIMVDDVNKVEVETASDKSDLLEYMKLVYGHSPEYFAELKDIIKNQLSV